MSVDHTDGRAIPVACDELERLGELRRDRYEGGNHRKTHAYDNDWIIHDHKLLLVVKVTESRKVYLRNVGQLL
jgi:hypothetical protein